MTPSASTAATLPPLFHRSLAKNKGIGLGEVLDGVTMDVRPSAIPTR
jgi:hypothetical protein